MVFVVHEHYCHTMHYHFQKGLLTAETAHGISDMYGTSALSVQKWFTCFYARNFELKDSSQSGWSGTADMAAIITVMYTNHICPLVPHESIVKLLKMLWLHQ